MYINHRPAFGLDPYEIYNAFRVISNGTDSIDAVPRKLFLDELQARGEHMTDYELADCLSHLMHTDQQVDEMSTDQWSRLIDQHLPEEITVDKFMSDLVGVPTENFDDILQTWETIRQANTPRVAKKKSARLGTSYSMLKEDFEMLESARRLNRSNTGN